MFPWRNTRQVIAADLVRLRERVCVLEREVARLMTRLETAEAAVARIAADGEAVTIEAEVARVEGPMKVRSIEAEVRAMAARLEATTPHYPRA